MGPGFESQPNHRKEFNFWTPFLFLIISLFYLRILSTDFLRFTATIGWPKLSLRKLRFFLRFTAESQKGVQFLDSFFVFMIFSPKNARCPRKRKQLARRIPEAVPCRRNRLPPSFLSAIERIAHRRMIEIPHIL
jgi:hypothetical protein